MKTSFKRYRSPDEESVYALCLGQAPGIRSGSYVCNGHSVDHNTSYTPSTCAICKKPHPTKYCYIIYLRKMRAIKRLYKKSKEETLGNLQEPIKKNMKTLKKDLYAKAYNRLTKKMEKQLESAKQQHDHLIQKAHDELAQAHQMLKEAKLKEVDLTKQLKYIQEERDKIYNDNLKLQAEGRLFNTKLEYNDYKKSQQIQHNAEAYEEDNFKLATNDTYMKIEQGYQKNMYDNLPSNQTLEFYQDLLDKLDNDYSIPQKEYTRKRAHLVSVINKFQEKVNKTTNKWYGYEEQATIPEKKTAQARRFGKAKQEFLSNPSLKTLTDYKIEKYHNEKLHPQVAEHAEHMKQFLSDFKSGLVDVHGKSKDTKQLTPAEEELYMKDVNYSKQFKPRKPITKTFKIKSKHTIFDDNESSTGLKK